jgi:hypothetical protein
MPLPLSDYLRYTAAQASNRRAFSVNFAADVRAFDEIFSSLQASWARVGIERDLSGNSQTGLLLFANILSRHTLVGFDHIASYQSFLGWLNFRPGLEALLMAGKLVDDPSIASVWKNRRADRKAYWNAFKSTSLHSRSLRESRRFCQALDRLNDEFMHPNPTFAYRDATQNQEGKNILVEIQFFDIAPEMHEAHVLAYLHLAALLANASAELVSSLFGPMPHPPASPQGYPSHQAARARGLARRHPSAGKVMKELGLWKF